MCFTEKGKEYAGHTVALTFGMGDSKRANRYFSLFVYVVAGLGVFFAILGIVLIRPIAMLLGADGDMLEYAVLYGRIILTALPFNVLQFLFQSFFVTAEKPKMGLTVTLLSGLTNMVLDAVLVILRIGKTHFDGRAVLKACTNGSSEFMSNISMSLVGMLYNVQLLKYAGEDGVAAYGVMMYVSMIFSAAFLGYSIGIAPVIGYHDGAGNHSELKGLLKASVSLPCPFFLWVLQFTAQVFLQRSTMGLPLRSYPFSERWYSRRPR